MHCSETPLLEQAWERCWVVAAEEAIQAEQRPEQVQEVIAKNNDNINAEVKPWLIKCCCCC